MTPHTNRGARKNKGVTERKVKKKMLVIKLDTDIFLFDKQQLEPET